MDEPASNGTTQPQIPVGSSELLAALGSYNLRHPQGRMRWYSLKIFSDGSGSILDGAGHEIDEFSDLHECFKLLSS